MRALALVWLFAGLRSDELVRLRLGCIRWQNDTVSMQDGAIQTDADDTVCLLDVPTNKTGTAFTKPVDPLIGRAIAEWEAVRPEQPPLLDHKTTERIAFLFCCQAMRVPKAYLNSVMIPTLRRKAGVPAHGARGRITSHRARATIASQLYNAKDPMTLAKAYTDAGYFARNVRTVEVLIDREAVEQGMAANGEPWQYFDLGHSYCAYSFFEQCPHRVVCARCDFYQPKESTKMQLLEAKENLLRMQAAIPLTEEERSAVEDDISALNHLLERLVDVPTPAGQTPQQLMKHFVPADQDGDKE